MRSGSEFPRTLQRINCDGKTLKEYKADVSKDGNVSLILSGLPLGFWIKAQRSSQEGSKNVRGVSGSIEFE
jgi:hypothetical protein